MADTNKKEYTSNLHPKGDMDTTVYPNVKSENIIDKDTTAYNAGKVPDSSLVSKSLDSLSENLETTKIQVNTNKTNIATMQGDVSSLKQDNQTTKATVAGLVSSDTQNKKDIANLKANYTEVQSQANTNSSNIALLETNAVKKDTDASLKSLTLPSASDLKIKDGSSFGNGIGFTKIGNFYNLVNGDFTFKVGLNGSGDLSLSLIDTSTNTMYALWHTQQFTGVGINGTSVSGFGYFALTNSWGVLFQGADFKEFAYKEDLSTYATKTDLNAKQSTLYRHTVLISTPTNETAYLAFTAESEKNTIIDSIQDLITVFGNTSIACSGIFRDGDPANEQSLLMINVGTSISNTTISAATFENNAITDFSNDLFTDTFGSAGFTITDNVTSM